MDYSGVAFPKQVRVRDRKYLAWIRTLPCIICGRRKVEASHIQTRGAGGGDVPGNVAPKCKPHHKEWGKLGQETFREKYPEFQRRLDELASLGSRSSVAPAWTRSVARESRARDHGAERSVLNGEVGGSIPSGTTPDSEKLVELAAAYLKTHGWHVLVAGGICVQKQPGSKQYSYELVIGFTGAPPRNDN